MRWIGILLLAVWTAMLFGGCGGGNQSDSLAQKVARASFTVDWPAPDRLIPDQAQSINVSITAANGFSTQQTTSRPASGQGTTSLTFDNLPLAMLTISVVAYPDPAKSTVPVAGNSQQYDSRTQQSFNITVSMNSTIDHITVTPDAATLDLGRQDVKVRAAAYDAAGHLVLTSPARLQWSSADQTSLAVTHNDDGTGQLNARKSTSQPVTISVIDNESKVTGSATVSVNPVVVTANPATAIVNPTASLDISGQATVTGAVDKSLTWSVPNGQGAITTAGVYTAPNAHGSYTVTATSVADPAKSATIAVDVPILLSLPADTTMTLSDQQSIAATMLGSTQGVTWTLRAGDPGTLTVVDGMHCTYKAPNLANNNTPVRITATSNEMHTGKAVSATITITLKTASGTITIN